MLRLIPHGILTEPAVVRKQPGYLANPYDTAIDDDENDRVIDSFLRGPKPAYAQDYAPPPPAAPAAVSAAPSAAPAPDEEGDENDEEGYLNTEAPAAQILGTQRPPGGQNILGGTVIQQPTSE